MSLRNRFQESIVEEWHVAPPTLEDMLAKDCNPNI